MKPTAAASRRVARTATWAGYGDELASPRARSCGDHRQPSNAWLIRVRSRSARSTWLTGLDQSGGWSKHVAHWSRSVGGVVEARRLTGLDQSGGWSKHVAHWSRSVGGVVEARWRLVLDPSSGVVEARGSLVSISRGGGRSTWLTGLDQSGGWSKHVAHWSRSVGGVVEARGSLVSTRRRGGRSTWAPFRYHGVLAARATARAEVVPGRAPPPLEAQLPLFTPSDLPPLAPPPPQSRHPWPWLLKRVFAVDIESCPVPGWGGRMRLVQIATEPDDIARVITALGSDDPARAPPRRPRPSPPGQLRLALG